MTVDEVVVTVSVEDCAAALVRSTEVGLKLELPQVRFPPDGCVVTEQLRVTTPVKPPRGVTVIEDVSPVVAP